MDVLMKILISTSKPRSHQNNCIGKFLPVHGLRHFVWPKWFSDDFKDVINKVIQIVLIRPRKKK